MQNREKTLRRTSTRRPRASTLWSTFDDCAPDRAHIDTTAAGRNGCARAWLRKASNYWLMLRRSDRRRSSCQAPMDSTVLHAAVRAARGIVAIVQSRLLLASTEGHSGATCCSSMFIVRAAACFFGRLPPQEGGRTSVRSVPVVTMRVRGSKVAFHNARPNSGGQTTHGVETKSLIACGKRNCIVPGSNMGCPPTAPT